MDIQRIAMRSFKPRARLLLLLGDQLIRDPGMAVFELVKNAYDADATTVTVTMKNLLNPEDASIEVMDDGHGMDWDTVTKVWLEPGTDYRAAQRARKQLTDRFHRLPLGEKGVGRFAAHKLGTNVRMVTRKAGHDEVVVKIDWASFESKEYLSDAKVTVIQRPPRTFVGKKTGTLLEISSLRQTWNKTMVRQLHRSITSICSPFAGPDDFEANLVLDSDTDAWLKGLLTVDSALKQSLFRATCQLEGKTLRYTYLFRPLPGMTEVKGRVVRHKVMNLPVDLQGSCPADTPLQIGKVKLRLHIFDRDPQILALGVSDKKGLKEFLDANGGIRVYREGVRVYDYGEPGNDWLDLGGRRVNTPTKTLSNNIVIGAVLLSLSDSSSLVEKTNREGFVETDAYNTFREAVLYAIKQIEFERNRDKERIRSAYAKRRLREPVLGEIARLRSKLDRDHKGLVNELEPYLKQIEKEYLEARERLLTAAGAGLSLSVVIHEVEKGIAELDKAVQRDLNTRRVKELATHLSELIKGLAYLTKTSNQKAEKASTLIGQALFNTEYRLRHHGVSVVNGLDLGMPDFPLKCTRRLVVATLMNLIDNSIWWLDNKGGNKKQLYIGPSMDFDGPAIIVADNGPGFSDPPELLTQPFVGRRPGGMGLGLHIASEIMASHGGVLAFPDYETVTLPTGFSGAIVALIFGGSDTNGRA